MVRSTFVPFALRTRSLARFHYGFSVQLISTVAGM
jgi:hypothetical protein